MHAHLRSSTPALLNSDSASFPSPSAIRVFISAWDQAKTLTSSVSHVYEPPLMWWRLAHSCSCPYAFQSPGNNTITLSGVLVPHNSTTDLAVISDLFTRYLNGESSPVVAKGLSTEQADGTVISWLSAGLQALSLTVPLKDPTGEIAPIKTITIGDFVRPVPLLFHGILQYAGLNSTMISICYRIWTSLRMILGPRLRTRTRCKLP